LVLSLLAVSELQAQFFPGGGGGLPGGAGTTSRSGTTRRYPNNGVGTATFSVDPDTRSLVVVADPDTAKYISEVVSNLDRPKPQVLIKVVFLEVTHNDALDLGIEGAYTKSLGNSFVDGVVTNFTVVSNNVVPSSITPLVRNSSFLGSNTFGLINTGMGGLYQVFAQDYYVTLHAIAQAGKAKVLSRPSIVTRNNQPATITVGQSVPLITSVRYDTFGNAINSVTYTSVGIILRVTPFITSEGLVEMILSPEQSELVQDRSQWVPIASSPTGAATVSAPLINTRSADTVVTTPTGQTVIIGGLMETSKAETVTKIPLLGDIPLLGLLFRHTIKNEANTELLIFLTPYVIGAPTEMAAVSTKEQKNADAMKAFSEKELNKFLDTLPTKDPVTGEVKPPPKSKSKPDPDQF